MIVAKLFCKPDLDVAQLGARFIERFAQTASFHTSLRGRHADVIELVTAAFIESENAPCRDPGRGGNPLELHIARASRARRRHPIVPLEISVLSVPSARLSRALHLRLRF